MADVKALGRNIMSIAERATLVGWARFAAVALCALVFYLLRYVVLPFALAAAFAYLAAPVVRALHSRCRLPHWTAALIVYVGYLCCVLAVLLLIRLSLMPQVESLLSGAPHNLHRLLVDLFHGERLHAFGQSFSATDISDRIVKWIAGLIHAPGAIVGIAVDTFALVMGFFMTLALLGYFLFAGPSLKRGLLWLVPPKFRELFAALGADVSPIVYNYVRGVLVVVAYASLVTWSVMHFIVHLAHAALIGITVGVLEMIPLFGPVLSIALIGLVMAERATPGTILAFAAFVTGLRISIDQLVGPLVLGKAVKLPPPIIIFAFLAGATLYGPVGILLAIPVAAATKVVLRDLYGDSVETMKVHGGRARRHAVHGPVSTEAKQQSG